jgi:hypothetical protein
LLAFNLLLLFSVHFYVYISDGFFGATIAGMAQAHRIANRALLF